MVIDIAKMCTSILSNEVVAVSVPTSRRYLRPYSSGSGREVNSIGRTMIQRRLDRVFCS